MNNTLFGMLAVGLVCLFLAGCASNHHTVVLVPDPDGHIGKAEVSTAAGRQLLEKPADMTSVSGASTSPSPVATATPGYIAATFGEALAVEPLPPEKFILFFESGTTTLASESRASIAAIVAACKRRGAISVAISGHTDASGPALLNEKLSRERAELVRRLLLESGIRAELMTVSSHGKRNPLVPTPDGVVEPCNRRVEVIVR